MHVPSLRVTASILADVLNDFFNEHEYTLRVSIHRSLAEPSVRITLWNMNQGKNGKITYYTTRSIPEEEFFIDLPCKECGK